MEGKNPDQNKQEQERRESNTEEKHPYQNKQEQKHLIWNQDPNSPDKAYDTLLTSAGELGLFQILLVLSTTPFYFFGINVYFSQLFMTEISENHWCWVPELASLSPIERRNLAIPKDFKEKSGYSHCRVYDANWTEVLASGQKYMAENTKIISCKHGWEFDKNEIPYPTISSELGWVCKKRSYQAIAQFIFFIGSVIGTLLIGWISDKYGRVLATVISNLLGFVGGLSSYFAKDIVVFSIARFIMGFAFDTCMMIPYLLVLEYTAPKYRSRLTNGSFAVFFSTFATAYAFIVLACNHWKTLALVSSIPLAFAALAPLFLPESPRWHLTRGRIDLVVKKMQKIARINRKQIPPDVIAEFRAICEKEGNQPEVSLLQVCKRPLLRKNMILVCILFMICMAIFDGLYRNLSVLKMNFFHLFAASSATELPSMLLCAFVMDILGRRWLLIAVMTINGLACFLTMFVGKGIPSVACAIIARFFINMSLSTTLQWSAELLPTSVRGAGVSVVITCGNLGLMSSPLIAYLKVYVEWLPYVLMGSFAATGVVLSFILPETARKELPHTFEQAETIAKNRKFWEMPWKNKN